MRTSLPSLLLAAALVACGAKAKPPVAPLPDRPALADAASPADKPADKPAEQPAGKPADEPAASRPADPSPPVAAPVDARLAATEAQVKLLSPGKGTRARLRLAPKVDARFPVEVVIDLTVAAPDKQVVPSAVLTGEAKVTSVAKDGTISYALTITGTDARDVADQVLPTELFKRVLAPVAGMTLQGTVSAAGVAGEATLHSDKVEKPTADLLAQVLVPSFPSWTALPVEPVAPGARWSVTSPVTVLGKVAATQVAELELVSRAGGVAKIKGTLKLMGAEQRLEEAMVTAIAGAGTVELELKDGALYPTQTVTSSVDFEARPVAGGATDVLKLNQTLTTRIAPR